MNNQSIHAYGHQVLRSCGLSKAEADLVIRHKIETAATKACGQIIVNASGDSAGEILIYEDIGLDWMTGEGVTAKSFDESIRALGRIDTLTVRINSNGGDVFDGVAIHNILARQSATVDVHIDSLAASAASFVAVAGDTVTISDNALMMIHDSWGVTMGNSEDMVAMAAILEKIDGQIAGMYSKKSGKPAKIPAALMDAETWLDAQESVDLGLADAIAGNEAASPDAPQDDISEAVRVRSRVIQLTEDSMQ